MLPGNGAVQYGVVVPHSMPADFDSAVAVSSSHRLMLWVTVSILLRPWLWGRGRPLHPPPHPLAFSGPSTGRCQVQSLFTSEIHGC